MNNTEGSSRKEYEEANQRANSLGEDVRHLERFFDVPYDDPVSVRHEEAKRKLRELYEKGSTEAGELNEEYDRLLEKGRAAMKAVTDFEKEKLGMH